MNFLAHAYLSFGDPDILIGNLIADFVRGKQIYDFREEIQQGIRLHRQIDEYTDHHPMTRETKTLFDSTAGRYNATFLDVAFDHFLALDHASEPSEGWMAFSEWCYFVINNHLDELPTDFRRLFSYMKKENWLYNYRHTWMIERSFDRLAKRAKFLKDDANVFSEFNSNYKLLKVGYEHFFPDLVQFAKENFQQDKRL